MQTNCAVVYLNRLEENLNRIAQAVPQQPHHILMVKANAYGHGMLRVANHFAKNKLVQSFGVATIPEAWQLATLSLKKPSLVFSNSLTIKAADVANLAQNNIQLVVHSPQQLAEVLKAKTRDSKVAIHLKINTGLNRLGIDLTDLAKVEQLLIKSRFEISGLFTHFAMANHPQHALTREQVLLFKYAIGRLARFFNAGTLVHAQNSAGIVNHTKLQLHEFCNTSRPGLALYGYDSALPVRPALEWYVRILKKRILTSHQSVGYDAMYVSKRKLQQLVLGVGYADGFLRSLSNKPIIVYQKNKKHELTVLGRVSMDLVSLGANKTSLKPEDLILLFGKNYQQSFKMAQNANTIIYEVLTSLSNRVDRIYTKKDDFKID